MSWVKTTNPITKLTQWVNLDASSLVVRGKVRGTELPDKLIDCTVIYTSSGHPGAQMIFAKESPEEIIGLKPKRRRPAKPAKKR